LTRDEHDEIHKLGSRKEEEWFAKNGVACYALASSLWFHKGDLEAMQRVVEANIPTSRTERETQ
jgi:hypothetical protein